MILSGEVSIITLGPLTNLALAIRLDSKFIGLVNQLIIMGSSVAGIGNEKPNVEFNFYVDPASNFIVFNSVTKPCILFPWETVHYNAVGKVIFKNSCQHFLMINVRNSYTKHNSDYESTFKRDNL